MHILEGTTSCKNCGANLAYNANDIHFDAKTIEEYNSAPRYVICPLCHHRIYFLKKSEYENKNSEEIYKPNM